MEPTQQTGAPAPSTPAPTPMNTTSMSPTGDKETQWGPVVGIVIIIALLILGGLYYWSEKNKEAEPTAADITNSEDQTAKAFGTQSTSSSYSALEADLNATNIDAIGNDSAKADAELQ